MPFFVQSRGHLKAALFMASMLFATCASAGDIIKVPLRWCAIDGSPAVTNPGGAGQPSTDTVLWRRHERATDGIWNPGAEITFRSGMIRAIRIASSFPIIADPCPPTNVPLCQGGDADGFSCTPDGVGEDPAVCGAGVGCATQACPCTLCGGELGDVLDPNVNGSELASSQDSCRDAWDGLEDQFGVSLAGPIVVNLRQFVNQFGFESPVKGFAAGPGLSAADPTAVPTDICRTPPIDVVAANGAGVGAFVDNQMVNDPDELTVAHELGHILWLRHGNGIDDDGDSFYDPEGLGIMPNCDPEETGIMDPPTLMHENGLQGNKTLREPQRLTAREVAEVLPGAKKDPPGIDIDLEALGEEQRDPIDDGMLIEMAWASILVNEVQGETVFAHGIPERVPVSNDTQFVFFADLDNDAGTGGSPNTIAGLLPQPTCFAGADIVTRMLLPFGMPPAFATVWRWDSGAGAFAAIIHPAIRAEVITTVPFDAGTSNAFETMALTLPNTVLGPIAEFVPAQAIAQLTFVGEGDKLASEIAGDCRVGFRMVRPDFPVCLVTPDPVDPGDSVTVESTGLWEGEPVHVLLGDLLVGEGLTDITGAVTVDFDIPIDSPAGPRLVTVGTDGTSLTADCAVVVNGADPGLFEEILVAAVRDTGEFVRLDAQTGAGTLLGITARRFGLSNRGARLFGIAGNTTLFELDPLSGATVNTFVPGFPTSTEGALAFRRDGVAFATRDNGSQVDLWRFGEINGGAVRVRQNIGIRFDGLAFDSNAVLFGLSEGGILYRIDTLTGIPEFVGSTTIRPNTTAGIAFDAQDRLYAVISDSLYALDTTTGTATLVGPTGFGSIIDNRGFSGLAAILVGVDGDRDGVPDHDDNCQLIFNPDQRDTNNDGFGNLCDADLNNDCRINFPDLKIMKNVFFSADPDADFNGDLMVNFIDLQLMKNSFFGNPGPSGKPNACTL